MGREGGQKVFLDWIMGMWVRKRIGFISLLQLFSYICRINSLNSLIIMENENKNQLQIELKEEVAQELMRILQLLLIQALNLFLTLYV